MGDNLQVVSHHGSIDPTLAKERTGKATDNEVPSKATIRVMTANVRKATYSRLEGAHARGVGWGSGSVSGFKLDGVPESIFFSLSIDGREDGWWSCRLGGFDDDGGTSVGAMALSAIFILKFYI